MCNKFNILLLLSTLCVVSCTTNVRFTSVKISISSNKPKANSKQKVNQRPKRLSKKANKIEFSNSNNTVADNKTKKAVVSNNKLNEDYINNQSYFNDFEILIIKESNEWLGTPYRYGGRDKSGIDCSAFVQNVYQELGLELPRTAQHQFEFSTIVGKQSAKIGDLVFFKKSKKITHVGIYMGSDEFIHSSTSKGVVVSNLGEKWYKKHLHAIARVKF